MTTVRELLVRLRGLDPDLEVGVVSIVREEHGWFAEVRVEALVDVDVVHDPDSGAPRAVWLTSHTPSSDTSSELLAALPPFAFLPSHRCDCLLPVAFGRRNPRVNLDAIACVHHTPNEVAQRMDALAADRPPW